MGGSIKVAVIGTGPVGLALAAHNLQQGNNVSLWAQPEHRRDYHQFKGAGRISTYGVLVGNFVPEFCDKLTEALDAAHTVIISVPGQAHEATFALITQACDVSQIQCFTTITGNFASKLAQKVFGNRQPRCFVETTTAPNNTRVNHDIGMVYIKGCKEVLGVASIPSKLPEATRRHVGIILPNPKLTWLTNTLELGFNSPGPVIHIPTVLSNIGWIEDEPSSFQFYAQGMSDGVCKIIEKLSDEVSRVASGYGIKVQDILDVANRDYGMNALSFREWAATTPSHNATCGDPKTTKHRFLEEDVPHCAAVWEMLGKAASIPTPQLTATIDTACTVNGTDYRARGRAMSLGINKMTKHEIIKFFE